VSPPARISDVQAWLLAGLFVLSSAALFLLPLSSQPVSVSEYTRAQACLLETEAPPAADAPCWRPVTLPELVGLRPERPASVWYRFALPRPGFDGLPGLFVSRVHLNAAVFLNGALVEDPGREARGWNRPLYLPLAVPLWRAGENELLLHLRTTPAFGMLAPVEVGPDALLRPRAERRAFVQADLSAAFGVTLSAIAVFLLGLWLRRRGDTAYLWLAVACACWAVFDFYLYLRTPPMPEALFRWVAHAALDGWMLAFLVFAHRFLGVARPRLERGLLGLQVSLWLGHAVLPAGVAFRTTNLSHAVSLLMALSVAVLAWQHWRRLRTREVLVLALATTGVVLAGVHDFVMQGAVPGFISSALLERLWREQFHLLYLAAPLLELAVAWHLTGRFVRGLAEAERLNAELEGRVAAAQARLAEAFEQRRALEAGQAATAERERIYRDLHDDLGSRLLSLAIGAGTPQQADTARAALQDLRDVVSRSGRGPQPLPFLLADWRDEAERRCRAAGLTLAWDLSLAAEEPRLSEVAALHLGRVLREALTNVLRHAQAKTLTITAQVEAQTLVLAVVDDGVGPAPEAAQGRGLLGMQQRAQALGGVLTWGAGDAGGCRVQLEVPLAQISVDPPSSRGSGGPPAQ
jgi:signal transduction histidine kinase